MLAPLPSGLARLNPATLGALALLLATVSAPARTAAAPFNEHQNVTVPAPPASGRERISINSNWRFTRGDPTNVNSRSLLYDVRPVSRGDDQRERLAEATEDAAKLAAAGPPVLKPWILPSGNRFIKDRARHFVRPEGNPRGDLSYAQGDFDDSNWRLVNLPHDWAIEGPFNSGGVGGSMGRLPSPGVGWYRKKLGIPASDAGKSIFLDVDGAMSYAAVWVNGKLVGGWPIRFTSEGPGEIVATDNGDPTSLEAFPSHERKAFNGNWLVIIRGQSGRTGNIKLTAAAEGLASANVSIAVGPK